MSRCPQCNFAEFYQLGDGRRRCKQCRHRYTFQSVWQASRIPDSIKEELLEHFAEGVPVYRQKAAGLASRPAIERFYRLVRAAIFYEQYHKQIVTLDGSEVRLVPAGEPSSRTPWWRLGEAVLLRIREDGEGNVFLHPSPLDWKRFFQQERFTPLSDGKLYPLEPGKALLVLHVRNGAVVFRKPDSESDGKVIRLSVPEQFRDFAWQWLWPYRSIQLYYLHLYLADVCFRFNHGGRQLKDELVALLQRLPRKPVEALLKRQR